jgi:translation initiation factor 2B subunit (eIF-2B alpha/beta/delta family)
MATIKHDVDTRTRSGQGLRESIITAIEKQVTHLEKSVAKVVSHSANLIADEYTVMTCSYSSTVFKIFLKVQNMGRRLTVLTVRSPSLDGSINYGVQMYKKLQIENIQTAVIDNEATEKQMRSVHMILVGADSLLSDGSIVNGSPTLQLAYEAARKKTPFYVACETWKVNPTLLQDFTPSIEAGMDLVPPELITTIVTENGLHDPKKIHEYSVDFSKRLKIIDKK